MRQFTVHAQRDLNINTNTQIYDLIENFNIQKIKGHCSFKNDKLNFKMRSHVKNS